MKKIISIYVLSITAAIICGRTASSQDIWTPQNSGTSSTLYRVQFINTNVGYATGDGGLVVKTIDGGSNWISVPVSTSFPVRDLSFINDSTGWIITGNPDNSMNSGAVWKTTNGGTNWEQQPLGTTQARLGISFVSSDRGWACGANNGPWDIRATTNGGTSWFLQSGSGFGWIYDIDCISSDFGWSVGVVYFPSSTGFVIKTTDGGTNWNQQNTGNVPFLYGVGFVDSDHGFVVGDAGTVLGTTNGGSSWSSLDAGTSANLIDLSFISNSEGWVCGDGGTVLMTTDGGSTWDPLPTGLGLALRGICFLDSISGWVVGDSGVILKYSPEQNGITESGLSQPNNHTISCNYPNPFNSRTFISFRLREANEVRITIYDFLGRRVRTLLDEYSQAGTHNIIFDASGLASGIYFYHLQAGDRMETKRMVLLK